MSIKPSHKHLWKDHDQHVRHWKQRVKDFLRRHVDYKTQWNCALWDGQFVDGGRMRLNLYRKCQHNPITLYQRIYFDKVLPHGMAWAPAECGNSLCLKHREFVPIAELTAAGVRKTKGTVAFRLQRVANGRGHSPLSAERVQDMRRVREESGINFTQLGKMFGVSKTTARFVCRGLRWTEDQQPTCGISFITSQLLGARA